MTIRGTGPRLFLLVALALAGCTRPPPEAYVVGTNAAGSTSEPVGADASGGACIAQRGAAVPVDLPVVDTREVFCGGYGQPAARILRLRGRTDAAQLDTLAAGGLWRTWLDQRVACGAPTATTLAGGRPARLLSCTRRNGGWPHVALVVAGPDGPVLVDGITTAAPVMERLALGGTVAEAAAGPRSAALEIALRRATADAFSTADVGQYEELMRLGQELNQAERYAGAEDAYRAALALQDRILGRNAPASGNATMHLALNLSNQGRQREAQVLFDRAEALVLRGDDRVAVSRLQHYRGLAALIAGDNVGAIRLLREADAGYAALLPASLTDGTTTNVGFGLVVDPATRSAVIGLSETRRYLALAYVRNNQPERAAGLIADSRRLLRGGGGGRESPMLLARSLRTEASTGGESRSASGFEAAARQFNRAGPEERPEAITLYQAGARRLAAGQRNAALASFRAGAQIARGRQIALPNELVVAHLDALDAAAVADPANGPALRREMFEASQLAQRSGTARLAQQAGARLRLGAADSGVGAAVRRLQDAERLLTERFAERDAGATPEIDARIAAAQQARAEAEAEVAAAAPGYRQLLLSSVRAPSVIAALGADEVFAAILLGDTHGWVMTIRNGAISAARSPLGTAAAARLVDAIRASSVGPGSRLKPFDTADAATLYQSLFGGLGASLEGATTLVVAPDGPLLALPFGLLLTGPADPADLGAAPWLLRRHAIVHVPSAQTFVTLRSAGSGSAAPLPYIGFGDFQPASAAQLARSFPADRCAADGQLAAGLGRLPGTRTEVLGTQELLQARSEDVRLGQNFTADSLRRAELGRYRIVHLATHALLPGELSCLAEPAIIVSTPASAADANASFVRASELLDFRLDADLVVLSACNTGGPGGEGGGEALSGLARALFFAGARGLLVTHWAVNDAAAALTVAYALGRQGGGVASATALRDAQLALLAQAGKGVPADWVHPYYWAPFALIGDGRRAAVRVASSN